MTDTMAVTEEIVDLSEYSPPIIQMVLTYILNLNSKYIRYCLLKTNSV